MIRFTFALLLFVHLAHAERVVIIAPPVRDPQHTALAAELQDAIDRGFSIQSRYTRAGDGMILPDELMAMFGCPRADAACARQAALTAKADLALLPHIERRGPAVVLRLELLHPQRLSSVRSAVWVIEPAARVDEDDALARGLRAAVRHFLQGDPPSGILISRPLSGTVTINGQTRPASVPVLVAPGTHQIERTGWPTRRITIQAGEIYLMGGPSVRREALTPTSTRRSLAWITAGAGVAIIVMGGVVGSQLNDTQRNYNATNDGRTLDRLARTGDQQAFTANLLFLASAAAFGAAAWLFWGP